LSNNSTALQTVQSNNATAITENAANNLTTQFGTLANSIVAPELGKYGQTAGYTPAGSFNVGYGAVPDIAALEQIGYTPGMSVAGFTIPPYATQLQLGGDRGSGN
jgi:hypothetical protein